MAEQEEDDKGSPSKKNMPYPQKSLPPKKRRSSEWMSGGDPGGNNGSGSNSSSVPRRGGGPGGVEGYGGGGVPGVPDDRLYHQSLAHLNTFGGGGGGGGMGLGFPMMMHQHQQQNMPPMPPMMMMSKGYQQQQQQRQSTNWFGGGIGSSYTFPGPTPTLPPILPPSTPNATTSSSASNSTSPSSNSSSSNNPGIFHHHQSPSTSTSEATFTPTSAKGKGGKGGGGKGKEMRICEVCGDDAKSLHFGGLSCDSCKAFFRRSVHKNGFQHFGCACGNSCVINMQTRKSCQKCRFDKCIGIGMEIKWVMSEDERFAMNKRILTKKRSQSGSGSGNVSAAEAGERSSSAGEEGGESGSPPTSGGDNENENEDYQGPIYRYRPPPSPPYVPKVEEMTEYMDAGEQEEIKKVCEMYHNAYKEIPYSVSKTASIDGIPNFVTDSVEIIGMFTTIIRRFAFLATTIPEFRQLTRESQGNLLKKSVLEMVMLRGAFSFDDANDRWPSNTDMDFLKDCPKLNVADMKNLVSPKLYGMHMDFISKVKKNRVDEPIAMLLLLIVLFNPERQDLCDIQLVSESQMRYCNLLEKYLAWKFGRKTHMFARLLNSLAELRELNENHNQYHLNLQEPEVNVIRRDLAQLDIEPYVSWKIVVGSGAKQQQDQVPSEANPDFPPPEEEGDEDVLEKKGYIDSLNTPSSFDLEEQAEGDFLSLAVEEDFICNKECIPLGSPKPHHDEHSAMRESVLQRVPSLIDNPFAPLITHEDMMQIAGKRFKMAAAAAQQAQAHAQGGGGGESSSFAAFMNPNAGGGTATLGGFPGGFATAPPSATATSQSSSDWDHLLSGSTFGNANPQTTTALPSFASVSSGGNNVPSSTGSQASLMEGFAASLGGGGGFDWQQQLFNIQHLMDPFGSGSPPGTWPHGPSSSSSGGG